jgi:hypothetical protein
METTQGNRSMSVCGDWRDLITIVQIMSCRDSHISIPFLYALLSSSSLWWHGRDSLMYRSFCGSQNLKQIPGFLFLWNSVDLSKGVDLFLRISWRFASPSNIRVHFPWFTPSSFSPGKLRIVFMTVALVISASRWVLSLGSTITRPFRLMISDESFSEHNGHHGNHLENWGLKIERGGIWLPHRPCPQFSMRKEAITVRGLIWIPSKFRNLPSKLGSWMARNSREPKQLRRSDRTDSQNQLSSVRKRRIPMIIHHQFHAIIIPVEWLRLEMISVDDSPLWTLVIVPRSVLWVRLSLRWWSELPGGEGGRQVNRTIGQVDGLSARFAIWSTFPGMICLKRWIASCGHSQGILASEWVDGLLCLLGCQNAIP